MAGYQSPKGVEDSHWWRSDFGDSGDHWERSCCSCRKWAEAVLVSEERQFPEFVVSHAILSINETAEDLLPQQC
jgi:hypothetical protein